eukprot:gene3696-7355_t
MGKVIRGRGYAKRPGGATLDVEFKKNSVRQPASSYLSTARNAELISRPSNVPDDKLVQTVSETKSWWRRPRLAGLRKTLASSSLLLCSMMPTKVRAVTDLAEPMDQEMELIDFRRERMSADTSPRSQSPSTIGTSFVRDAVRRVGSSVVRVDCEREVSPFFLFPDVKDMDTVKVGASGIIISADGYILTNAHVVENAKKVTISLSTGRVYKCNVISSDELTDLALIKANIGNDLLTPSPLGDSSSLHSGDWVVAVGNPVGLDFTVTLGIISNPHRSATEVGAPHLKGYFIQTDAALNNGNSGGPLVNEFGQVIGINTMVRSNTEAIGFAIPINQAKRIYHILKQGKKPSHAYFGLEVMTLSPDVARIHNDDPNAQRLPEVHGALVTRVVPGSPAATFGLRKNDIIINVNGASIPNAEEAEMHLDLCSPGQYSKLRIARGDSNNNFEVDVDVTPNDLQVMVEERKRKLQMMLIPNKPSNKE